MREKVVELLTTHDALRAGDREEVAAYLREVFAKAESYDALAERVTSLENVLNH